VLTDRAQAVAGWLMGLAWDALWNALISPQQEKDKEWRAWRTETDRIMELLDEEADPLAPFAEKVSM
jgi:hypothetical protein